MRHAGMCRMRRPCGPPAEANPSPPALTRPRRMAMVLSGTLQVGKARGMGRGMSVDDPNPNKTSESQIRNVTWSASTSCASWHCAQQHPKDTGHGMPGHARGAVASAHSLCAEAHGLVLPQPRLQQHVPPHFSPEWVAAGPNNLIPYPLSTDSRRRHVAAWQPPPRTLARSVPARKRDLTQKMIRGTRRIRVRADSRKPASSCNGGDGRQRAGRER